MDKLEELHLDVIESSGGTLAAYLSAEITKDIAIEFLRWAVSNPTIENFSSMSKETAEYYFIEFLKTV
jgi:accessory colonization factor AcfC